ncbi:hypothetical protein [Pararhizobium haloflavum]|uniref:hypothetical protein n=1 Tax=Pararhizobium haloflavum TaxID=2037914 RepID=UPI000C180FE7|nr:hypothetical protein [Pararhizobium haloflavum]
MQQPGTLTKAEFAAHINVSKARVSQLVKDGVIGPDCLAGEGRSARVIVARAVQEIRRKRDVGQSVGNGLTTRLDEAPVQTDAFVAEPIPTREVQPRLDTVEDQIKREKLAHQRMVNRRAAEEEETRRGSLMPTDAARVEMTQIAATMMQIFEGALPEFATAIAGKFELPQRDVLHELKQVYRDVRKAAEARERRRAASLSATEEVEIEEKNAA